MKRIEFKVGQKVVALMTHNNELHTIFKGGIYTVTEVEYCRKCSIQAVGVGYYDKMVDEVYCVCGNIDSPFSTASTFSSSRFASLDNLSESIEEAVSNEDYELAQTLTEVAQEQLIHTLL